MISEDKTLDNLETSGLTITGNKINKISLDNLVNATETKIISGNKFIRNLSVKNLEVENQMWNVSKSALKIDDEGEIKCNKRN